MFGTIFSWLIFLWMIWGVFFLITRLGDALTGHPTQIDVHVHPVRTVRDLTHIIERDGEMYVFEETEDCIDAEQDL